MTKRTLSEGLGSWLSSLRFSGFTVLVVALIVVGGLAISPTLSTYVKQQREIAELRESVRLQNERVAEADRERAKWQDPAYVRSQARGRLFYVMPGETQLSVISDVVIPEDSAEVAVDSLSEAESNWAMSLAVATLVAGTGVNLPEHFPAAVQGSDPASTHLESAEGSDEGAAAADEPNADAQ